MNDEFFFFRWIHLSIHGGVFVGANDGFVFAIDTPVYRSIRLKKIEIF